ncbi:hypothetical protein JH26_04975 [Microvirga sp. BSC39]|jgi:hypothetical protein|nr:hypothetical protein JH26_04975 [Microvirga sp. BSC39]
MIGALGAVGATAYLLPSFADGRLASGGHLPEVVDVQPARNNADARAGALLDPYSPLPEKWQNLPLLAMQSSTEVAAGGEVQLLTLQAAFERERGSAVAAQLQVAALQERLASLQEKQEEVLVLREQLADTEAHTRQTTGPTTAETEQKAVAEKAMLKVTALQEELASLSTQVLKAKTTAESEKARAASALAQLEAVQHQLAVVTTLQSDRTEADKPRRSFPGIGIKPLPKPVGKSAAAPVRTPEPDASRLTGPRHEPRNQSAGSVGKPPQRASQQPRLVAQDTRNRRGPGALSLPNDLLPDNRLW